MRRFVAAFFRHPFTLILPAILIPLIVVFAVRTFASSYSSSAIVFITNNPYIPLQTGSQYDTAANNLKNNIEEYMNRPSFLLAVANRTDMPKTYPAGIPGVAGLMAARITDGLSIASIGKETLTISYSDSDPHLIPQVIVALLQEYRAQTIKDAESNADLTIKYIQDKLQQDEDQLAADDLARNKWIQSHPNTSIDTDSHLALLQSQYENDLALVQQDQQTLQKVTGSAGVLASLYIFEITDPPKIPTAPTVKSKITITAMIGGVALGLGVSLGLIGLLAMLDRRIHSRDDLLEGFPLPVLEVVPRLRGLQEEALVVGSAETLSQLSQVPVLATLPRLTGSGSTLDGSGVLTARAEDEK
ncbi:MAG TPA: hypothetical protein VH599_12015 [Ktedonobacterales bacterium]|jgi:hypothetical protein